MSASLTCVISITRLINASKVKITTPRGIQESTYIDIGGIKQYIQIRGEDIKNPVILWLHGGPGFPLTYLSYYYQTELERDYTIVCWEQRGCSRTFFKNNTDDLSVELILNDIDEIVDYLLKRFDQEEIIIMGQSWGTVLGMLYLNKNPEKISAYIGIGQVTDFDKGKIYAAESASNRAKEKGNEKDAIALEKSIEIFKKSTSIDEVNIKNLEDMIVLSLKYLRSDGEISGLKQMWLGISSPNMSINDFRWFIIANNTKKIIDFEKTLINYMYYNFDVEKIGIEFEKPICFIQGSDDWITPTDMTLQYYNKISTPYKEMFIIKNSGHTPFLDHPKEFCDKVKDFLSNVN